MERLPGRIEWSRVPRAVAGIDLRDPWPDTPWLIHGRPSKKERLSFAKDLTDLLSQIVPLVAGTIYMAGYFITAGDLAEYG